MLASVVPRRGGFCWGYPSFMAGWIGLLRRWKRSPDWAVPLSAKKNVLISRMPLANSMVFLGLQDYNLKMSSEPISEELEAFQKRFKIE